MTRNEFFDFSQDGNQLVGNTIYKELGWVTGASCLEVRQLWSELEDL